MARQLRRAALLLFPKQVLNAETLDTIVAEGFTDVGAGVAVTPAMKDQGFNFEQSQELAALCHARGLGFIAFTGYMKYQYQLLADEPSRLMLLGGHGKVEDLDGLPVRWLCPFRPENQAWYRELLLRICEWPAVREIHLNDEASLGFAGGRIACYCDHCQATFAAKTGKAPPLEPDWASPAWYGWLEHRFDSWIEMHAYFRDEIKKVRPDIAVGVQHSPYMPERIYNAWESGVCLGREAQRQDLIATDPYHFNHADGIRHRPHRRILSETTRSLVGACLDRQVDIYPQGFMPPSQAVPMGRGDGLLAGVVPFALGADLVMPFSYEMMKIIPGFFEAFDECRELLPALAAHRPYAFATMIMPQQSEIYGHHQSNWAATGLQPMIETMYRTGLPWRWFWDQRLDDLGEDLQGPVILPQTHCLTQPQLAAVDAVARRGEGLLWIGSTPAAPWVGHGPCPVPEAGERGSFELVLTGGHPITDGIDHPVMLGTRTAKAPFAGAVIGTIDGEPALVVREEGECRQAWLAGLPVVDYFGTIPGNPTVEPTGNLTLVRHLLRWLSGRPPAAWLAPFPPTDDYRDLRPTDRRSVPTLELLPMISEDRRSLLAIIFPYTPVRARTALHISGQVRRATELWTGNDWSARLSAAEDGGQRIELEIPGDCDLLALQLELV